MPTVQYSSDIVSSAFSWEPLVIDLVLRTDCAVVFPEFTLAPTAQYPVQQEQCLAVVQYILKNGGSRGLKVGKIALAGDASGSTCSTAMLFLFLEDI